MTVLTATEEEAAADFEQAVVVLALEREEGVLKLFSY